MDLWALSLYCYLNAARHQAQPPCSRISGMLMTESIGPVELVFVDEELAGNEVGCKKHCAPVQGDILLQSQCRHAIESKEDF